MPDYGTVPPRFCSACGGMFLRRLPWAGEYGWSECETCSSRLMDRPRTWEEHQANLLTLTPADNPFSRFFRTPEELHAMAKDARRERETYPAQILEELREIRKRLPPVQNSQNSQEAIIGPVQSTAVCPCCGGLDLRKEPGVGNGWRCGRCEALWVMVSLGRP